MQNSCLSMWRLLFTDAEQSKSSHSLRGAARETRYVSGTTLCLLANKCLIFFSVLLFRIIIRIYKLLKLYKIHHWNFLSTIVILRMRPKEVINNSLKVTYQSVIGLNRSQMSAIRVHCHFTLARFPCLLIINNILQILLFPDWEFQSRI